MTASDYARWTAPLRARPWAVRVLRGLNRVLRWAFYLAFAALLACEAAAAATGAGSWRALVATVLVCGACFALVSLLRAWVNAPRPYEALAIDALIHKDTRGRSFPSRHVFSCFAIAGCWCAWCWPAGVALLVAGAIVAVIRVLGGVHWPRDVAAGAALGLACGALDALALML